MVEEEFSFVQPVKAAHDDSPSNCRPDLEPRILMVTGPTTAAVGIWKRKGWDFYS